jgi:hypothetical protein
MHLVINYVHKLQGLDKALPTCWELKKRCGAKIVTILDLEGSARHDLGGLLELTTQVSDEYIRLQEPGIVPRGAPRRFFRRLALQRQLAGLFSPQARPLMLAIYHGTDRPAGAALARLVKRNNGRRVGYLKSLHDQGRGLSDLHHRRENTSPKIQLRPNLDRFLTPAYFPFERMLEEKGIPRSRQIVAGYPVCYASWHALVKETPRVRWLHAQRRALEVVVFTRGEADHKVPEVQIISDEWVLQAVRNIVEKARAINKDCRIRVKPHPYQDLERLRQGLADVPEIEFTDDPPCVLVATADLAIATYSSAILDAVAFGVPAIEYFQENRAFRLRHPDGSPFGQFGVVIARNESQFGEAMSAFAAGHSSGVELGKILGETLDVEALLR